MECEGGSMSMRSRVEGQNHNCYAIIFDGHQNS